MVKRKPPEIPKEIDFTDEPRGKAYKRLVDFAQIQCTKFSLVWRDDLGSKRKENEIAKKLETSIISDTNTNKLPGTEIFSGKANVCTYKLNQKTAKVLTIANRLYQWEAPDYPEDLAFYNKSGQVWLGSVAHEKMGWLNTESIEELQVEEMLSFLYANGIINKKYF